MGPSAKAQFTSRRHTLPGFFCYSIDLIYRKTVNLCRKKKLHSKMAAATR